MNGVIPRESRKSPANRVKAKDRKDKREGEEDPDLVEEEAHSGY